MIVPPSVTAEEQEIVIIINNNCKLFKPHCRTDIFKNSFWNRHIDEWNNLWASVADLESVNSFRKALRLVFTSDGVGVGVVSGVVRTLMT